MKVKSSDINKTKASLVNVVFNYGSSIVLIVNTIFLVPFYLNYMSLSDYGAWLTAIAATNLIMLVDPGISSVSSQRMSKSFSNNSDKDFQGIFISSIVIALIFSLLIVLLGFFFTPVSINLLNYDDPNKLLELEKALKFYVLSIALTPIYSTLSAFLQSLLQTFKDNTINLISIVTSPFVIVVGLINDLGLVSLALGVFVPNFVGYFYIFLCF